MGKLGEIWRRLRVLARRDAAARELGEEMRLHREMKERELIAGGEREAEARYAAARAFGNGMSLSERGREAWGWRWLENLAQDCLFAMRGLRKSPGFAATAVITLILGIGATTAIFSVVNTVLLRPLPYGDPARLVRIEENHDGATNFFVCQFSRFALGAVAIGSAAGGVPAVDVQRQRGSGAGAERGRDGFGRTV